MSLRVHYLGQLMQAAGRLEEEIERNEPCSVADLVRQLAKTKELLRERGLV